MMQVAQNANGKLEIFRDIITHNLRIFGFPFADESAAKVNIFRSREILTAEKWATNGGVAVVWVETGETILTGETIQWHYDIGFENKMSALQRNLGKDRKISTLHPYASFSSPTPRPTIVSDATGRDVWVCKSLGKGKMMLLGTDLAQDLIRFRQGDPAQAKRPDTKMRWGVAGERPNYLYEQQRKGAIPYDRDADWWMTVLTQTLENLTDCKLLPLLPNNSKGAIVITGDDDQAYLEKYQQQLQILDGLPITYFLHPLTRHTQKTLKAILKTQGVDLGIHPDAIETPEEYGQLFAKQSNWYRNLTGKASNSVRNHGFLNDGYWGHLASWQKNDVKISSNIPGLDGNLITSSLIPARVYDINSETLTNHWSIITAIGDGAIFAHDMSHTDSRKCVLRLGAEIMNSGLPGIMVLNLHPQNISESLGMHEAIKDLVKQGFLAWNIQDCLDWFNSRDQGQLISTPNYSLKRKLFEKLRKLRTLILHKRRDKNQYP